MRQAQGRGRHQGHPRLHQNQFRRRMDRAARARHRFLQRRPRLSPGSHLLRLLGNSARSCVKRPAPSPRLPRRDKRGNIVTGEFPPARVAILMGTKWKQDSSYLVENKRPASVLIGTKSHLFFCVFSSPRTCESNSRPLTPIRGKSRGWVRDDIARDFAQNDQFGEGWTELRRVPVRFRCDSGNAHRSLQRLIPVRLTQSMTQTPLCRLPIGKDALEFAAPGRR